jgi:hypothetical protein
VILLLAACSGAGDRATWLEGFGFGWTSFNHRLSQLVAETGDGEGQLAFVGGTSTTGIDPPLPPGCESGCQELPFVDTADADLRYGAIATRRAHFAVGAAELVAGAAGAEAEITVDVATKGTVFAVLRGLRIGTDEPLEGEPDCYDPALGWHPRRIAVALGAPQVDGHAVTVPVSAWFEAGNSLEDIRACIDRVHDRARVRFTVDVLVVSTNEAEISQSIRGGMVFPLDGEPQVPTDDIALAGLGPDALAGWSAIDWRFFEEDPDERGAYLRTIDLGLDPAAGTAHGQATNYSPLTQISGFDYAFDGVVTGAVLPGEVLHGHAGVTGMAAALDADGAPVVTQVTLEEVPR